jgi:uncharacterized protein YkwD
MRRLSPTSRWVVLPTVLGAVAVVAVVATTGARSTDDPGPRSETRAAAAGAPAPAAAPAVPAPTRERAAAAAPAAAGRFHPPAARPRPTASPTPTRPAPTRPVPTATRPAPTRPAPTSSTAVPPPSSGGVTAQVVALTNAERAKAGCGPLAVDATLTSVAQAHSQDMASNDYFSHDSQDGRTPFARMTAAGYRYSTAAENIAAGQRTAQDVMTGWMNSPGHKANILNCALTQIGVGHATGGSYGVYWTQDFGTPR